MTDIDAINQMDFASVFDAARTLRAAGFRHNGGVYGIWWSEDGKTSAVIKQRFRDSRYYVVFFV
jgi:hypothetical protein